MSYILNALKHSENQRSRGEVPHLDSQPECGTPAPRRLGAWVWPWAALFAAAALLFGLGWVGFAGSQRQVPAVNLPAPAFAPAPVASPAPAAAEPSPGLSALQQMAGVRIRLGEALQPLSPADEAAATLPVTPRLVLNLPVSGGFVPPAVALRSVSQPFQAQSVSQPFQAQAGVAPASEVAPAEQLSGVSHWKTAPPELQKQLRELAFTAHIYSSNPAARFVRVSGRTLHEGAPFGAELQLLQITRDGLVFSYRKDKFWMGATN
jgi:general secretion pathway protein B